MSHAEIDNFGPKFDPVGFFFKIKILKPYGALLLEIKCTKE